MKVEKLKKCNVSNAGIALKQMTMARTFQACETIVQTATVKGDEDILRVTGSVNNNLDAAEARYHKACHATYICKKQSAL